MKYIITLFCLLFSSITLSAQVTETFGYQAVIRDGTDMILANSPVGMQISILENSPTGTAIYVETHTATTNINGLVSIQVGGGTPSTGLISDVDWGATTYYIKTEMDLEGGTNYTVETVAEISSTPYALHSNTAEVALTADYPSLTNLPTTITQGQIDKLSQISVTSSVDLDQLSSDVTLNNSKVTFPGFGTLPGTALEGDNVIWEKTGSDVFYNQGRVGIGVDDSADFGGAQLLVNGGIKYSGMPSALTEPGLFYYDAADGDGKFHYVDNLGVDTPINDGSVTYNSGVFRQENGDIVSDVDVAVQSSIGVGIDTNSNTNFGFNTMVLAENNLRILFDDTDDPLGAAPSNDWQIEINETFNGGASHFAINDITNNTVPFKIMAGAPSNSIFIAENGNVGIGTGAPSTALEVVGSLKANNFIGDGSGLTGITGATGGISNVDDTLIAADNDANTVGELSFETQNTARMTITNDGNVGIGTTSPSEKLEVAGTAKFDSVDTSGTISSGAIAYGFSNAIDTTSAAVEIDVSNKAVIYYDFIGTTDQTIVGFNSGIIGQRFSIVNTGQTTKTITHNTGTQPILLPGGTNITLGPSTGASFIYDGAFWYCIALSN